jgi:outer membrane biosynthesis protein TonB
MRHRVLIAGAALLAGCIAPAVQAGAPEVLTAPVLRSAPLPVFPLEARHGGHSDGHAVAAVTVDADGRVMDAVALEASHPAFATAVETGLREWLFEPLDAATRPRRELVQFEFRSDGTITQLSHADSMAQQLAAAPRENQLRTVLASALPQAPVAAAAPPPRLLRSVAQRIGEQPLAVSFVIDTHGRVRVPVVPADADPQVAAALLEALHAWRFAPQRVDGELVLVQVQRVFRLGSGSR